MSEEGRKKLALAQVYLARLVMLDAPNNVIMSVKDWCVDLEKRYPISVQDQAGFKQGVGVSDAAVVEIETARSKN